MHRPSLTSVTAARLEDGGLLLITPSGNVLHGNATAAHLWEALLRTGDRGSAAETVARAYHVPVEQVRGDLDRLLATAAGVGVEVEHL